MTSFVNGKAAKLRASCDACNESKVRCSQAKPKCQRCQRQDVTCIYGLSRRSHKSAPRIGASYKVDLSASEPPKKKQKNTTNPPGQENDRTDEASESNIRFQEDMASRADSNRGSIVSSTNFSPEIDMFGQNDTTDMLSTFGSAFGPVTDGSTESYDFLSSYDTELMKDDLLSNLPTSEFHNVCQIPSRPTCNCMSRVVKQLLSIPNSFGEDNASFDSHLLHLRSAISVLENCTYCSCMSWDEMSLMTISVLIGRVLQGFEAVLLRAGQYGSPSYSSTASDSSSIGKDSMGAPRLFSNALHMDQDEEDELKKHLWRMQFRKLTNVLDRFNESVGRLRIAQDQGATSSAHVMACQCIHMWLLKKAESVSNGYLEQDGAIANSRFESREEQSLV
ncbi:hypothetical protein F4775DRAFT_586251 [Biscogniauxia sp. FL1348]|nr:hypothetical protein F4775DRAFT_586251 [Biscogniauxia sp. FL1348]